MSMGGNVIRLARFRSGLTQRELAARAGTSAAAIALYEKGHRDPTVETMRRICRAAGWDIRMRLEPPDRMSETLPEVLERYYSAEAIERSRERRQRALEERQAALGIR